MLAPCVHDVGNGLSLWGVEFVPGERRSLLRLYIDAGERSVTLDDCEAVSREVSALLDVNDPISGNYSLEVSSPGLDRPLFKPEQYQAWAGSMVKLTLALPVEGRKRIQGVIESSDGTVLALREGDASVSVPHSAIHKARVVPEFDPPAKPGGAANQGKPKRKPRR
ncbi:MAG: ribosome maturation factor RimP [Xanthomonadales bacterium]|nr:ribosome maturation factor RimP [Xanthomonadales bacterium]